MKKTILTLSMLFASVAIASQEVETLNQDMITQEMTSKEVAPVMPEEIAPTVTEEEAAMPATLKEETIEAEELPMQEEYTEDIEAINFDSTSDVKE